MSDLSKSATNATSAQLASTLVNIKGDQPWISLSADHLNDAETASELSDHVTQWIESRPSADATDLVAVDLAEVAWVSSVGLNELIEMNRSARKNGVRLVLTNVQTAVREVLVLTRLERMFNIDWEDALICKA
ncbi:STAS domain protein [Novipirellula aureliae]|uniref:STAS domain protein n=1 Tax=Novipirellula aureliae TaxID=2527966 RepID=A0A5C6E200_9BACT|nr:STAS domain-containing protein [Novipirellula aureliae]TWU42942.1 STAS domain protein [Novipirellula aureliae]